MSLALATGIHPNLISQFEGGHRRPGLETMLTLAKYFDVTVEQMLGLQDVQETPVA